MDGGLSLANRQRWAQEQFGSAALGDVRRTRRLVMLAAQMAGNSSGSIPQQTGAVAEMKAAYRLFSADDVTHEAICQPHFVQTRERAGQLPLAFLIQDTAELNYTSHHHCEGLSPIGGAGSPRGLHQQNVLAVDPFTRRPLGLMYQRHHHRQARPEGYSQDRTALRKMPLEQRESYWWVEAIRAIGSPPSGVRWVHVGDRGEDIFGAYDEARHTQTDWLIRLGKDRRVETPHGVDSLFSYARQWPCTARRTIHVRRKNATAPEKIELNVAAGAVTLLPSRYEPGYRDRTPIECRLVRVWERNPRGSEPLEWLLCTTLPCETTEDILFAAEGYSLRWMIEEFHKCEKTGCQVEMRQLEHVDRLEPLIGLLSVLGVWLLQLKFVAREEPTQPASVLFDDLAIGIMARYLKRSANTLTIGDFWRGIGRLGGHPGRKGDGAIGWLRAWRGWQNFQLILLGASLNEEQRKKCG